MAHSQEIDVLFSTVLVILTIPGSRLCLKRMEIMLNDILSALAKFWAWMESNPYSKGRQN